MARSKRIKPDLSPAATKALKKLKMHTRAAEEAKPSLIPPAMKKHVDTLLSPPSRGGVEQTKGTIGGVTDPKPPQPPNAAPQSQADILAGILSHVKKSDADTPAPMAVDPSSSANFANPAAGAVWNAAFLGEIETAKSSFATLTPAEKAKLLHIMTTQSLSSMRGSPTFKQTLAALRETISSAAKTPEPVTYLEPHVAERSAFGARAVEQLRAVERLRDAVTSAIGGDTAPLEALERDGGTIHELLSPDAQKYAWADAIKRSGNEGAAHAFLTKALEPRYMDELKVSMAHAYGPNEPMLAAFSTASAYSPRPIPPSPPLPPTSPTVSPAEAKARPKAPPSALSPSAPSTPPPTPSKGAGWTDKVSEVWAREIDEAFNDAREGDFEKLDTLVDRGAISSDALITMAKDRIGLELVVDDLKREKLSREADEQERQRLAKDMDEGERRYLLNKALNEREAALGITKVLPDDGVERVLSDEEHAAMERSGKLDRALSSAVKGDKNNLQQLIQSKEFSVNEITSAFERLKTLPNQNPEEAARWWNLQSWAAQQQELQTLIPEKSWIRRGLEWYGSPERTYGQKVAVGAALAIAGSTVILSGLALAGIGSATIALMSPGAIIVRGVGGAALGEFAAKLLNRRNLSPIAKGLIKAVVSMVGGTAAGLAFVATDINALSDFLSSKGAGTSTPLDYGQSGNYGEGTPPSPSSEPPTVYPPPSPSAPPIEDMWDATERPETTPAPQQPAPTPNPITHPDGTYDTPTTPNGKALPNVPAPEVQPAPAPIISGEHFTVSPGDTVGRLGLWGSFTEDLLRSDSFLSRALENAGIDLPPNLEESFAMAVNQILYENPDLLKSLCPTCKIIETATGLKSIVPPGAIFSGSTMEEAWKNLFNNESFYDKLSRLIENSDNYRSLGTALKVR